MMPSGTSIEATRIENQIVPVMSWSSSNGYLIIQDSLRSAQIVALGTSQAKPNGTDARPVLTITQLIILQSRGPCWRVRSEDSRSPVWEEAIWQGQSQRVSALTRRRKLFD